MRIGEKAEKIRPEIDPEELITVHFRGAQGLNAEDTGAMWSSWTCRRDASARIAPRASRSHAVAWTCLKLYCTTPRIRTTAYTSPTVLGVIGVASAFGLLYLGERVFHLDRAHSQTLMYLKLSMESHLTIFLTPTHGPFWSIRSARML